MKPVSGDPVHCIRSAAFEKGDRTWTVSSPGILSGIGCCSGKHPHLVTQKASEHRPTVARFNERDQLIEATRLVLVLQGVYKVIGKERRPVWHSHKPCMHLALWLSASVIRAPISIAV